MMMKAIVKPAAGPGLELTEVPKPEPAPNEVRIKILKTSICGTDVHIDQWDDWASKTIKPPMTIGHEFVGVIDAAGPTTGFEPGLLVSGEGHIVCGECRNCHAGRRHLCPNTRGVGVNRDGAFAEYLCIPAANVWRADPRIPLDILSCFDPLGNAAHTALSFNLVGEDVLITGAGPIGCMAIGIAQQAGARHVVVTDLNPKRLAIAKEMGADAAVDPRETDLRDVMKQLDMREGFDVGLEMSGSPAALAQMIDHMITGGNIALLGILPNDVSIDWNRVIFGGLTLKGIYGRKMYETWYKMTVLIQDGLDISPVITHRFAYTEFREAFDLMASGQSGKIVLDWSDDA